MASEFIHGLSALTPLHLGCVATIGSFDGVHRGHQAVLKQVIAKASEMSLPSLVMVFEPQPSEFFSKQKAPARLMRLREKVNALLAEGVDRVLCLKFDRKLRNLTANQYIESVLVSGVGVKHLVIGDDFRFGCDRAGDFAMLLSEGKRFGFSVADTHTYTEDDERISSTRIRQLLESDRFDQASQLLGHPFSISGRVIYGRQLGQTLGFPTANVGLGRYRSPVNGVYAVTASVNNKSRCFNGVANVGVRPTVDGGAKPLLEVHLLDCDLNLYGTFMQVDFLQKIRQEVRFSSIAELQRQIEKDVTYARKLFAQAPLNN